MSVASTSIENYREHKATGKLGAQASEIARFMAANTDRDWTRSELAEQMNLRLSSVCGRVNELIQSGDLTPQPHRRCQITGKTVTPVRLCGLF